MKRFRCRLPQGGCEGRGARRRRLSGHLLVAVAVLALSGCESMPDSLRSLATFRLDPLSVDGRDGAAAPPRYNALMRVGEAARAAHDYANAISLFRRAAEIRPREPAAFIATGDTLADLGQANEAIAAYNSALQRDPASVPAQIGVARAYLMTSRPELALEPLRKAAASDPRNRNAVLLLGIANDMTGQHLAAQGWYRHGLAVAPRDPAFTVDLALSLALAGQYPQAIGVLQPIATAPGATAAERQTLALIYGLAGNKEGAMRLGRVDLDEAAVEHNLAYYETLRQLSPAARTRALLSLGGPVQQAQVP